MTTAHLRTALAALLAAAFLLGGAGMASAADPSACDPAGDQAVYVACLEHENAVLRGQVDALTFHLMIANAQTVAVEAKLEATQSNLDNAYAAAQRLLDRFNFWHERAIIRRAKIIELRHELRDLT